MQLTSSSSSQARHSGMKQDGVGIKEFEGLVEKMLDVDRKVLIAEIEEDFEAFCGFDEELDE